MTDPGVRGRDGGMGEAALPVACLLGRATNRAWGGFMKEGRVSSGTGGREQPDQPPTRFLVRPLRVSARVSEFLGSPGLASLAGWLAAPQDMSSIICAGTRARHWLGAAHDAMQAIWGLLLALQEQHGDFVTMPRFPPPLRCSPPPHGTHARTRARSLARTAHCSENVGLLVGGLGRGERPTLSLLERVWLRKRRRTAQPVGPPTGRGERLASWRRGAFLG